MKSTRISLLVAVTAILGSLVMGVVPAQAASGLGTGLIRIDAGWASIKTLSDGSTVLTLDKEASGQWMGEVATSVTPVVRDIDDSRLVTAWNEVGHGAGVDAAATVTWNSLANYQLIDVGDPSMTPRGHLRFVIDADANLPNRIENVTLNIHRSQQVQQRSFPFTSNFQITSTATTQTTNNFAYVASVTFKDSGLSCYSFTLTQSAPQGTLPANLNCDSVTYNSGSLAMTLPLGSQPGNVFLNTTMTVSGSPFQFAGVVAQWPLQGT
jgi:hypothetical protein